MKIGLDVYGLDKVRKQMDQLQGPALRGAMAKAINDTAFQKIRPDQQARIRAGFNNPTPFIERSPRVVKQATAERLEAVVGPTYRSDLGTKGGKIGVDPQQVLQAQQFGGRRANKRSENALKRAGILPAGMQTVVPDRPFPGSVDVYGNIRGPFVQQLLSYFQAYRLAGDSGNMSAAGRRNVQQYGKARLSKAAKQLAGPRLGRRYFVAYGRVRGGVRTTRKGDFDSRVSNLAPGIWATLGSTGADVRPVLMFVRQGSYRPKVDLQAVSNTAEVREYLGRRMRFRIREAAGV